MTTCEKIWRDIPFAHRQPAHKGHCHFVHGHNWTIQAVFVAREPDDCGFVMDFGDLKDFKRELERDFDHSLVINEADPERKIFLELEGLGLVKLKTVDNCSCEGLAKYFCDRLHDVVSIKTQGRVAVASVTVFEDGKNSATFSQIKVTAPSWSNLSRSTLPGKTNA